MDLNNKHIFDGHFGLERETLRVTADGMLAQTPHPFAGDERLDRDFCENQLELITPACDSIYALMDELTRLDRYVRDKLLKSGEYLWLCSNPPHIEPDRDIPIADFRGEMEYKRTYREKLETRYGKRLMLYSGIHFNFSFSDEFLKSLHGGKSDFKGFKNALYFRLSKWVFRYSWLLVLLTAASPVYDLSLNGDGLSGSGFDGYASMRGSDRGYWNKFVPILDYTDISAYINSVKKYVDKGLLFTPSELYLPVRLKPHNGSDMELLIQNGVDHIELRMFDLNPLSPVGIFADDLEFAHYFLIYLLLLPDFEFTPELQETAVRNHKAAAGYDLSKMVINGYGAKEAAMGLLDDMRDYYSGHAHALEIIDIQRNKIINNERYCVKVYETLSRDFQREMLGITKSAL